MQLTRIALPTSFVSTTFIIAAWISLLVAPQLRVLPSGASPIFALGLSVLSAIGLALVYSRILRISWSVDHRDYLIVGIAHLPLLLLWALPVPYPERLAYQPHLWVCAGTVLLLAGVFGFCFARRPESRRFSIVFLSVTVIAIAAAEIFRLMTPGATIPSALVWGLFLLASMVGWGTLVNRTLLSDESQDWGQRAAWGLAALVVMGGVLNLTWSISPRVIETVLALGFGLWAAEFPALSKFKKPSLAKLDVVSVLMIFIAAAALVQLGAAAAGTIDTVFERPAFDLHDDQQAYLVFPEKMLQLGSMGPEPFEARRMLSMGAQPFLQTLVLTALPMRSLHLVEMGIAPLILLGLVIGYGQRHRFDRRIIIFMALFVLAIPHLPMRGNTSAMLTGIVLFVSLFRIFDDRDDSAPPILLALVIAALVALKSTFIPAAVTIFGITSFFALVSGERRRTTLRGLVMTIVLIAIFCLPWMISIFSSSATLLYPIFGKGYYGGVFTGGFSNISAGAAPENLEIARSIWRHIVALFPSFLLLVFVQHHSKARAHLALLLAAIVSVICIVAMGDPEINRAISRYSFPVVTATLITMLLAAFRQKRGRNQRVPISVIAALTVGLCMTLVNQDNIHKNWDQIISNLFDATSAPAANTPAELAAYQSIQKAIQESLSVDGTLLATLDHPALLDFTKRQTFIMSLPGMAMLPPGMPIFDGPEAVASYLLNNKIPLLAYGGIGDEQILLKLSESDIRSRYPNSKMRWIMLRYHQQFNRIVEQLALSRKRLYEDEHRVVLDLRHRVTTFSPAKHPERTTGFIDDAWTDGFAVIKDLEKRPNDRIIILHTYGWRPSSPGSDTTTAPTLIAASNNLRIDLNLVGRTDTAFAYHLPPEIPAIFDLQIRSATFSPQVIGSVTSAPRGIDVRTIEIGMDEALVSLPTRTLLQHIDTKITPENVWHKSGFFIDFNWTDGDGVFNDLDWPVPPEACNLIIELNQVHPWIKTPERIALRVSVNNIELTLESISENTFIFNLFDGLATINRLRFESATIVPQELGNGEDKRHLGVPIKNLRFNSPF